MVPAVLSTWYVYQSEVVRVEGELQETNRGTAQLAARLLLSIVDQAAVLLTRPDLPGTPQASSPIALWEVTDARGTVRESTTGAARVGSSGYADVTWRHVVGTSGQACEVSDRVHRPGAGTPTVLVRIPWETADGRVGYRVAWIDLDYLKDVLAPRVDPFVDRHVYAVGADGRAFFYRSPDRLVDPDSLPRNPPVARFLAGGAGPIRFTSAVSGKERVGVVLRLDEAGWGLVVSADIGAKVLDLRTRFAWIAAALVVGGALAVLVFFAFSRAVIGPLRALTGEVRRADRAPHEALRVPPSVRRIEEFDRLAAEFDDHIQQGRRAEAQAVRAEKLATLGELTAGLAHEIGTPLNVMRGNAQLLMKKLPEGDPGRAILEKIVRQTARIADLIRGLLDVARTDTSEPVPVSLARVLLRGIETAREMYPDVDVAIDLDDAAPAVPGFPRRLEHALLNLLVNACQAMDGRGTLRVATRVEHGADGASVVVRVEDQGCGISPDDLPKIFQPFYTTKASGKGTGLGLSLVDRVVREHGGTIEVNSEVGRGTRFEVRLPPGGAERTEA
jgi:signal transduction histidine kinase